MTPWRCDSEPVAGVRHPSHQHSARGGNLLLATSDDVPGLVAQGRTVSETIEIARDVARKPIEARGAGKRKVKLSPLADAFDYPLVVGA